MPPELAALLDKPHLLIAVLAVGSFFGVVIERFFAQLRRQAWREKNRGRWKNYSQMRRGEVDGGVLRTDTIKPKQPDAADQLRVVMSADFEPQALLNKSESRVFKELDRMGDRLQSRLASHGTGVIG
jgi:hypothetical protein